MCVCVCVSMSIHINVWMDVHENIHSGFLWVLRNMGGFLFSFYILMNCPLFYNK